MKRRTILLTLATFLSGTLHAQATGQGAESSAQAAQSNNGWQNWAFTGTALVTAAAGVVAIALNNGSQAH